MTIRHYVLLATDGNIELPNNGNVCTTDTTSTYIFGFIGGLYQVKENGKLKYENPSLNWENADNWQYLHGLKGEGTVPSPLIWGEVGDRIYITLINLGMFYRPTLMDPHTVHLHGAHVATQIDGFPETSFGVPMWMVEGDIPTEKPPVATYFFEPENPGTYMYHCHVEASEHVQMGMYGALVIYPSYKSLADADIIKKCGKWYVKGEYQHQIPKAATNRSFAYNDINTYFDKEYVMLLSDIDWLWHNAVRFNLEFNPVEFKPNYWLVNGRAFPDTLLPHPQTVNEGDPNLTQINYESYVHVNTNEKFLLRMINMGYQVVPWHIHGWHFTVVGKDAHPSPFLKIAQKINEMEHWDCNHRMDNHMDHEMQNMGFTATIGSGETFDLLLVADDKRPIYRNYIVNGQDEIDSLCQQIHEISITDPAAIFDVPTEPVSSCPPNNNTVNDIQICEGTKGFDQFFPQFYPAHNHDDYKVTNDGTYPGGQLIFIQADEPKTCHDTNTPYGNWEIDIKIQE